MTVSLCFQVPVAARPNQAELMAFKWIRDSAKNKMKNVSFWTSLARELLDAANNTVCSILSQNLLSTDSYTEWCMSMIHLALVLGSNPLKPDLVQTHFLSL